MDTPKCKAMRWGTYFNGMSTKPFSLRLPTSAH
ncbi:uncharacterized protein RSE6_08429 [Rhynchosporium secalis]|uniref:Uncharacterized protein n=1 Tax=Rhynchosporium secalis TaxID=38038 RepID=A0A1E1MFE7_RHYSE|nr:uncharacterized protein RSE6_08429 [Rhynchosporium secalis]